MSRFRWNMVLSIFIRYGAGIDKGLFLEELGLVMPSKKSTMFKDLIS
jgi:hypothetical protein